MTTTEVASQEAVSRKIPNAVPCGLLVRVINPTKPQGADIYCENLVFKEEFKLDAGSFIDCDLEMARAAKKNWEFLEIKELDDQAIAKSKGETYIEQEEIALTQKVDINRYTYMQKKSILSVFGKVSNKLKENDIIEALEAMEPEKVFKAVKVKQLPIYLISRF